MKEEHSCLTTYGVHPNVDRLLPRERIPAHTHRPIHDGSESETQVQYTAQARLALGELGTSTQTTSSFGIFFL